MQLENYVMLCHTVPHVMDVVDSMVVSSGLVMLESLPAEVLEKQASDFGCK
jgi:hypothetical protein